MRNPESTKSGILDAAKRILIDDGLPSLTIDGVAKRAGVSKGAVLHHYRSKEELVVAMVRRECEGFDEQLEELRRREKVKRGSYTRAYLRAMMGEIEAMERGEDADVIPTLEEFRNLPAAQAVVRWYVERWQGQAEEDGLEPEVAGLVRYAADGMWMEARTGCSRRATQVAVLERLWRMAGGTEWKRGQKR